MNALEQRGADVASDHHMVVTKLKMKLNKHWTIGQAGIKMFNMTFLRDANKLSEFGINLSNKLQVLRDLLEEPTTESN